MDSSDQGASNIATSETTFSDNQLMIKATQLGMAYKGMLENDSTVVGTFTQGSMAMHLTLTKREGKIKTEFPYQQEGVYFTNLEGSQLVGTLTIPKKKPFKKAVVLISGSGP